MTKQQTLILFSLFVCFIQIHSVVPTHLPKIRPRDKIITIPLNPSSTDNISYGWMDKNRNIRHLKIMNKKFIPPVIVLLPHLKRLEIRNTCFLPCNCRQVPPKIKYLASSLMDFRVYDTQITHLPNEIGKLRNLETLILSNTGLMSLPDSIGDLSLLTLFYLPKNKLTSLPVTIKNLRSLKHIILTDNPYLHSIESLNDLPFLRILDTSLCSIEFLPRNLPNLAVLNMSNNNLTNLTDIQTLGNGTDSKKSFYFDRNSIQSIPFEIGYVRNLSLLNLNHNQLKSLPLSIFNINTLDNLHIINNSFSTADLEQIIKIFQRTNPKLIIHY